MSIPKDLANERDELALKEHIYEPKYGGKDHSGYDTMMKYEINYEREECFEKGFDAGVQAAFSSEHVAGLVEALTYVLSSEPTNKDGKYCPINQHRFVKALEALAKWEKRNE